MKETLINSYLKIEPLVHTAFVSSQKDTYEEVGKVVARDEFNCGHIPLGSNVFFDSFMAKKYPVEGEIGKFQWFIHLDEIVKFEHAD